MYGLHVWSRLILDAAPICTKAAVEGRVSRNDGMSVFWTSGALFVVLATRNIGVRDARAFRIASKSIKCKTGEFTNDSVKSTMVEGAMFDERVHGKCLSFVPLYDT